MLNSILLRRLRIFLIYLWDSTQLGWGFIWRVDWEILSLVNFFCLAFLFVLILVIVVLDIFLNVGELILELLLDLNYRLYGIFFIIKSEATDPLLISRSIAAITLIVCFTLFVGLEALHGKNFQVILIICYRGKHDSCQILNKLFYKMYID